jgi:NADH-quinone oxidoreductase subunit I
MFGSGLFKGLKVTLEHLVRPAYTVHYPFDKVVISPRTRARHGFRIDPVTNEPLCIGCQQCAKICPDRLIVVKTSKAPEGSAKKLQIDEFTVDISACMFCGLCEDVCPTDAIVLTPFYEMATQDKKKLYLDKNDLIDSAKNYEPPA